MTYIDNYTFIHYIQIKRLVNLLNNTKKYFNQVSSVIKESPTPKTNIQLTHKYVINNLFVHTEYLIQKTDTRFDNIKPHIRNQRGLINFVGKAKKWLFGTLDSDDAERYD